MKFFSKWAFTSLVFLSLLTPFWVFTELLFPFVTSKAFYFRICVEAALPFYLYLLLSEKKLRPNLKNPINISVLAFLLFSLVSALLGEDVSRSMWGNFERMGGVYYLAHLTLLLFYVQALKNLNEKFLRIFLHWFVLSATLISVNGLLGKIGLPTLTLDPSLPSRISSTLGNPIYVGSFLILPVFVSLYLFLKEQSKGIKIFLLSQSLLMFLGIYFSGTRGAMVGFLAAVLFALVLFSFFAESGRARTYVRSATLALVMIVVLLFSFKSSYSQGSVLRRLTNLKDSNSESRLIQWKSALRGFSEKPISGIGPENYYVVFNKFYNPEMYRYDGSWFDKPHNYPLEVLVTTGIVGFLPYLALNFFGVWFLWLGYKKKSFSFGQFIFLLAGLLAYQIQNLFVFDTVPSSLTYFIFFGLVVVISEQQAAEIIRQNGGKKSGSEDANFLAKSIFGVSVAFVCYLIYVTNIIPLQAAKAVNLGYAYTSSGPKVAADFFHRSLSLSFLLDRREISGRYSDFAAITPNFANDPTLKEAALKEARRAVEEQQKTAEEVTKDPLVFIRLAKAQLALENLENDTEQKSSLASIDKAVNLAPKRVETWQMYVEYYSKKQDWFKVLEYAQKSSQINPYSPELKWQVALAYYLTGEKDQAAKSADQSYEMGMKFQSLNQFAWYIQYALEKKDFPKAIKLLELAIELEPNETGLYFELAKAYAGAGDKDRARTIAEQVGRIDPSLKAKIEEFIKLLK